MNKPVAIKKITLHYVIENNGDGSASVSFYPTAEDAGIAADIEDQGEPIAENLGTTNLYFDDNGTLLNPEFTRTQLEKKLIEAKGGAEYIEDKKDYDRRRESDKLEKSFKAAARKKTPKKIAIPKMSARPKPKNKTA